MPGIGMNRIVWTKELDDKLIRQIRTGKTMTSLEIVMRMGQRSIKKRLKEMGYSNFMEARDSLIG